MTEDFRLYHDLVAELKARDIPFVSLSFSRKIPENVGVIVTSPAEADRVQRPHVVAAEDRGPALRRGADARGGPRDPAEEPGLERGRRHDLEGPRLPGGPGGDHAR